MKENVEAQQETHAELQEESCLDWKKRTRPAEVVARHGATSTSFVGRIGEGAAKLWRAIEAGLTTVAFHRYLSSYPFSTPTTKSSQPGQRQ